MKYYSLELYFDIQLFQLMMQYNMPEFNSVDQFLAILARRMGRLRKGARPDVNAAARKVGNFVTVQFSIYHYIVMKITYSFTSKILF